MASICCLKYLEYKIIVFELFKRPINSKYNICMYEISVRDERL